MSLRHPDRTDDVLDDVRRERTKQDSRWGQQDHGYGYWLSVLTEEIGEACREHQAVHGGEVGRREAFRRELVQAAAVATALIECGDRNGWWPT